MTAGKISKILILPRGLSLGMKMDMVYKIVFLKNAHNEIYQSGEGFVVVVVVVVVVVLADMYDFGLKRAAVKWSS